jgi:RND superfamily putative drug exporter
MVSANGRIGYIAATLSAQRASTSTKESIDNAIDRARSAHLEVEATTKLATDKVASNPGQLIGMGSFLAARLPLLSALLGLGVGISGIYATTALVTIFIVNRHRRQVPYGLSVPASIRRAMGTAGSAVFFAGSTVVVALAALSIVHIDFLTQMGLAGAGGVLVAVIVALTPALLSIIGTRIVPRRTWARASQTERAPKQAGTRSPLGTVGVHPTRERDARLDHRPSGSRNPRANPSARATQRRHPGVDDDGSKSFRSLEQRIRSGRQRADPRPRGRQHGLPDPRRYRRPVPHDVEMTDVDRVIPSGVAKSAALPRVIPQSGPSDTRTETLLNRLAQ